MKLVTSKQAGKWSPRLLPKRWVAIGVLLVTILLGSLLRLHELGSDSLWADELETAYISDVHHGLSTVVHLSLEGPLIPIPPLWFVATHFLRHLGEGEFILRLPVALLGILALPMLYRLGRDFFGEEEGLVASLLLAFSIFHLRFSQEARYYAGLTFFSLASLYCLLRATREGGWRWWAAFMALALANIYTHLFGLLVLLVEGLYVCGWVVWKLLSWQQEADWKRNAFQRLLLPPLGAFLAVGVGYLPMLPYLLAGMTGPRGLGGKKQVIQFATLKNIFVRFSPGNLPGMALFAALFLAGLACLAWKRRAMSALVLAWFAVPLATLALVGPKHWFETSYVIFLLPIYLLTIATGVVEVGRLLSSWLGRWSPVGLGNGQIVSLGLGLALALLNVPRLPAYYRGQLQDWRGAVGFLQEAVRPGNCVIITGLRVAYGREAVLYYGLRYYGLREEGIRVSAEKGSARVADLVSKYAGCEGIWVVKSIGPAKQITEVWLKDAVELSFRPAVYYREGADGSGKVAPREATALYGLALQHAPDDWTLRLALAESYQAAGDIQASLREYEEMIKRGPGASPAREKMAQLLFSQGRFLEAAEEYQKLLQARPKYKAGHYYLALAYEGLGRKALAIEEWKEFLALNPTSALRKEKAHQHLKALE